MSYKAWPSLQSLPNLTLKVTCSKTDTEIGHSNLPPSFYISSHGLSSAIIDGTDDRIKYQLTLSYTPNTQPFSGYTITLTSLPGRGLDSKTNQDFFYRKRFLGEIVSQVDLNYHEIDGQVTWQTYDGKVKLPHDLDLNI